MGDASSAESVLKLRLPAAQLKESEIIKEVETVKQGTQRTTDTSDNADNNSKAKQDDAFSSPARDSGDAKGKTGNFNLTDTRNSKDNELIFRMSPSPERFQRKRSNTFSESPRSGKQKFISSMAALVMYASMEDNEVEAAKLLTNMGSASKKAKLPDFLMCKSPERKKNVIDKEENEMNAENKKKNNERLRPRGSSFDALTATAAAAIGEESSEIILPLPPMPNKTPSNRGSVDSSFTFSEGRNRTNGEGAGIAERQRRTASGRAVVPDFANFATGGVVVRNVPTSSTASVGGTRPEFKDLNGPAYESLRRASRGSSIGSAGGSSVGECRPINVRSRAETISDGPSHTVNRMDKIGIYGPEERKARIERFLEKRRNRVWAKKVKYDVRKNFADSRLRIKGRFVKKEDEAAYLTNNTK